MQKLLSFLDPLMENLLLSLISIIAGSQGQHFQSCVKLELLFNKIYKASCVLSHHAPGYIGSIL